MISTYNILGKMENPLCVTVQRSAGFFYFATVKLGVNSIKDRAGIDKNPFPNAK